MSSPSDGAPPPPPSSSQGGSGSSTLYHSLSLGRHGHGHTPQQSPRSSRTPNDASMLSSSPFTGDGANANTNDDDDDAPLGASLGGPLPRRNHTISSGTTRARAKKLPQHFEQPSSPPSLPGDSSRGGPSSAPHAPGPLSAAFRHHNPASPSRNSLREITGAEDDHDNWEREIDDEHHHSAVELLANLPESSTSSIRRHQSLNHHIGRSMASRLAGRHNDFNTIGPSSPPPSITSQLQSAFEAVSPSGSARHSPTKSLSTTGPWSDDREGSGPAASPSRFARHFASNSSLNNAAGGASPVDQQGNLLDVHAKLQALDITASSSAPADTSVSPINKKLPSLITNPDVLAAAKTPSSSHQRSESIEAPPPLSAAPILGHNHSRQSALASGRGLGHSRVQSTDGVLYGNRAGGFSPEGNAGSHIGLVSPPPPSLAGIFGPHTAAPISQWGAKERLAGMRGGSTPSQPYQPQQQQSPMQPQQMTQQQPQWTPGQHQRGESVPSQWGMALSPVTERDQVTIALSQALAEQQQKTAMLEAALRARGGIMGTASPGTTYGGQQPSYPNVQPQPPPPMQQQHQQQQYQSGPPPAAPALESNTAAAPLVNLAGNPLNPVHFELSPPSTCRFLVIKSFTEDDVHRSIRHGIWASTDKGNQRLNRVYSDCQRDAQARGEDPTVYLFFSVNGSGHFCGMARMTSPVDFSTSSDVWAQEGKWKGTFAVEHIYVKDVPNRELRHIKLPNHPERKNVTQSRDTQELDREGGVELLRIMHAYPSRGSLLGGATQQQQQQQQQQAGPPPPQPGMTAAAPAFRFPDPDVHGQGPEDGLAPRAPIHLGFSPAPSPHLAAAQHHQLAPPPPQSQAPHYQHHSHHQQRLASPPMGAPGGGSPMLPPIHLGFGGQLTPSASPGPYQQQAHRGGGGRTRSRSPMPGAL